MMRILAAVCLNMAATIEAINQRPDLALSKFQEIAELKVNLKDLRKENIDFKKSLSDAYKEIAELKEISKFHERAIEALQIGVNGLQKEVKMERERAIRLESHSRRNSLNFSASPKMRRNILLKRSRFFATLWKKSLELKT